MITPIYTPADWYWQVGEDAARWWSSAAAAYVTDLPAEATPTWIGSEAELWEVLRQQAPGGLPAEQQRIKKSVVQQRLIDAGLIDAAYAALVANPAAFARWFAPGHTELNANDADAIALLVAIGADPAVVLAPE